MRPAISTAVPEDGRTGIRRGDDRKKDFHDWKRISNSGIESWWRHVERLAENKADSELGIAAVCNREHTRERARSQRDKELKQEGRLKKERSTLATRDERVEAIFQNLGLVLKR